VCNFLHEDEKCTIKTLIYRAVNVELDLSGAPGAASLKKTKAAPDAPETYPEAYFAVCMRGDLDVNEAKLAAFLKAAEVSLATEAAAEELTGAPFGSIGPVGLTKLPVIADESCMHIAESGVGALEKDYHYIHVVVGRDWKPWKVAELRTVKAGDRCPLCGGELYEKKGNELGHIFKLGTKYTKPMHVSYLDEGNNPQVPIMGCYGIGIDRTLASIIEEHHDAAGIIWPASVAPFHVHIVPIKYDGASKDAAENLAAALEKAGLEVLIDDRAERAGVKFNDADLIGIPWRVVIGDKNLKNNMLEIKGRNEKEAKLIPVNEAAAFIAARVGEEMVKLS
jgi:prolyl-tRNA synthetase